MGLLRRLVVALERQAQYAKDMRDMYARAERQREFDREAHAHRQRESDDRDARSQAVVAEAVGNQRSMMAKWDEALVKQREHVARCEAWHRQHCGPEPVDETGSVN